MKFRIEISGKVITMFETLFTAIWMIIESTVGVVNFIIFSMLVSLWAVLTTK